MACENCACGKSKCYTEEELEKRYNDGYDDATEEVIKVLKNTHIRELSIFEDFLIAKDYDNATKVLRNYLLEKTGKLPNFQVVKKE